MFNKDSSSDKNNNFIENLSDGNISDDTCFINEKSSENFSNRNSSNDIDIVEEKSSEKLYHRNSLNDTDIVEKNSIEKDFSNKNISSNKISDFNKSEQQNISSETFYADSAPDNSSFGTGYSTNYYSENNSDENLSDYSYGNESSDYTQPYFIENINKDKNVKNVTKFPKSLFIVFISIALVVGITLGTFISGPIKDHIKNWLDSYKNHSSDPGNIQSENPDNSIIDENGFLTYATDEKDASALSTAEIAAKCLPSVVEIRTETVTTGSFFQEFVTEGAGSGVIITKNGYIVTNYHVIAKTNAIYVTLNDGNEYEAKLIGTDEKSDLAVVKIDADNLTPAVIGDSDKLVVGEKAVAIGNPLGELGGTVTDGIISALDREMTIEGQKLTLLQTNAAINPGNSGGGLFNGLGNLIAIVDAKSSGTGIEGLGFAIPSNKMSDVVNQIINYGYVKGYIDTGMTLIDINDYYTAMQYRVNEFGVYVLKVYGQSALDAGFQSGDLILSINGKSVDTAAEINSVIENMNVGDSVEFKIYRSRTTLTLNLKLDEYVPKSQT